MPKKKIEVWKSQLEEYHARIDAATEFVKAIEQGDLDTLYKYYNKERSNPLADSLIKMREQMKKMPKMNGSTTGPMKEYQRSSKFFARKIKM